MKGLAAPNYPDVRAPLGFAPNLTFPLIPGIRFLLVCFFALGLLLFFFFSIIIIFWPCLSACGILVFQLGIEPVSSAVEAQSSPLDHQGIPSLISLISVYINFNHFTEVVSTSFLHCKVIHFSLCN